MDHGSDFFENRDNDTPLQRQIREAVETVYEELGGVFQEAIYQAALCVEFTERKMNAQSQPVLSVQYKNRPIGTIRPDFLVISDTEKIILEIKVRESRFDCAQVRKYIDTCDGVTSAMLVHFGCLNLKIRTNFTIDPPEEGVHIELLI